MSNDTPMIDLASPDSVTHTLDRQDVWPATVRESAEISRLLDDIKAIGGYILASKVEDAFHSWAFTREDFMFSIGVAVGAMRARGVEPDDLDAETLVAAARRLADERDAETITSRASYRAATVTQEWGGR
jgi:hypothetical protein